jgi:hypothetical protein
MQVCKSVDVIGRCDKDRWHATKFCIRKVEKIVPQNATFSATMHQPAVLPRDRQIPASRERN